MDYCGVYDADNIGTGTGKHEASGIEEETRNAIHPTLAVSLYFDETNAESM